LLEEIVKVLNPFEEITRHISEKGESVESWLDLIYGSSLEDSEQISDSNTSINSDDKANILSAENRKQCQYTHRTNSIEDQIQAELFALEPNYYKSDNEKTQNTIEKDCDSLSAELW
ncbi:14541_t:CDS:2, partial [Gigaspora margarita]